MLHRYHFKYSILDFTIIFRHLSTKNGYADRRAFRFFFAIGFDGLIKIVHQYRPFIRVPLNRVFTIILIVVSVWVMPEYNYRKYAKHIEKDSSVTRDDMVGFQWLSNNVDSSRTVVKTNYGDGGQWLSSITGIRGTGTHVNVLYLDKLPPEPSRPKYVFIGSKCVYKDSCGNNLSKYSKNRKYKKVFQSGNTYIFRRKP